MNPRASGPPRFRSGEYRNPLRRGPSPGRLLAPRLAVLFLAGLALFGYPFLGLFAEPAATGGVPSLYVYLFLAWALFVVAIALLAEPGPEAGRRRRDDPP